MLKIAGSKIIKANRKSIVPTTLLNFNQRFNCFVLAITAFFHLLLELIVKEVHDFWILAVLRLHKAMECEELNKEIAFIDAFLSSSKVFRHWNCPCSSSNETLLC